LIRLKPDPQIPESRPAPPRFGRENGRARDFPDPDWAGIGKILGILPRSTTTILVRERTGFLNYLYRGFHALSTVEDMEMIEWPTSRTEDAADRDFYNQNSALPEAQLISAIVENCIPDHPGLTENQSINLLRHVLRDKMGTEAFDGIRALGTKEEGKELATVFEGLVEAHLRNNCIRFKSEQVQKREWELGRTSAVVPRNFTSAHAATFRPTGGVDEKGRGLFGGSCILCGHDCIVPFQPFKGMKNPPKCRKCHMKNGKLVATPDFLCQGLTINGSAVAWIDCKCFYGSHSSSFVVSHLSKQARKYNEIFGRGAFVFAFGFCESLVVEGTLLLDATPVDLSTLLAALEEGHRRLRLLNADGAFATLPQSAPRLRTNSESTTAIRQQSDTRSDARSARGPRPLGPLGPLGHWDGNEHLVTALNCEQFGLNDYLYDKYGGMMGIDSWFDGDGEDY
jgi:hypothetical protein